MRTEKEIIDRLVSVALADDRIRAVLLNGSRANIKIKRDAFQDFDIVYVVTEIDSFVSNQEWVKVFGDILLKQLPDTMTIGNENNDDRSSFGYLMLFRDGNRIDLTLIPVTKIGGNFKRDSLTKVLLDKDSLFSNISPASDTDYIIRPPNQKQFSDVCNEFWWVSTYVAKGLARNQITYTREMMDKPVRSMFMKVIAWYIGIKTNFSVDFGVAGKYMEDYLPAELYKKILLTYPDHQVEHTWNSLFLMADIFSDLAKNIATALSFNYNLEEEINAISWLTRIRLSEIP